MTAMEASGDRDAGPFQLTRMPKENTVKRLNITLPAIIATAALLTGGAALAGPPDHDGAWHMGPPSAEDRLAIMNRELDLTAEQSRQMLELLQAAEAEQEAVRARIMDEMGPEMCAIRQNTEEQIIAILSPAQADLFDQLKLNRQSRNNRQGGRFGALPDCP
jgi:Spy/CpxP family protein refolding chaperone